MKIDVTFSVILENVSKEVEQFLYESMKEYGLAVDLAETVLQKTMYRILSEKNFLYANALYEIAMTNQNTEPGKGENQKEQHVGTSKELIEAFKNLNKGKGDSDGDTR